MPIAIEIEHLRKRYPKSRSRIETLGILRLGWLGAPLEACAYQRRRPAVTVDSNFQG